jgi:hypothetical protein
VIFRNWLANFDYQSEEEAGSAGEQPASNKIDGHTVKGGQHATFFIFTGVLFGFLNSFFLIVKMQVPFDKVLSVFDG